MKEQAPSAFLYKFSRKSLLVALVLLTGLATVIFLAMRPGVDDGTVRIGVILPLTGDAASYGQDCKNGLLLAFDEARTTDGLKFKPIIEDTKAEPKTAVTAVQKLISVDRVEAVIGDMFSSTTLAVAPIAQSAGVTLLTPTSSEDRITATGDCIFSIYPSARTEGEFLASRLSPAEMARVAVLSENQEALRSIAQAFSGAIRSRGGEIVAIETLPDERSSYRSVIDKIAAKKPAAVFLATYRDPAALIIINGREAGLRARFICQSTLYDEKALADYPGKLEDVLVSGPYFDPAGGAVETQRFRMQYQARYGRQPTVWAAYGFDAARLVITAVREAHEEGVSPKEKLAGRTSDGLTGRTTFRPDRSAEKAMVLFEVKGNKFERR